MERAWQFLDGKKTIIGTTLLLAAQVLPLFGIGHHEEWAQVLYMVGTLLGGSIAGLGVGHKMIKGSK